MNSDFDVSQYLNMFLDEAEEELQELEEGIVLLEQEQQDKDLLNRIFRAAHTLKGSSASMGFEDMATLTHDMENVLDRLRMGKLTLTKEIVDLLLECLDALKILKENITSGEKREVDVGSLSDRLKLAASRETGAPEKGPKRPAAQRKGETKKTTAVTNSEVEINEDMLQFTEVEKNVIQAAEVKGFQVYHLVVNLQPDTKMKAARAYIVFNNLKDVGEVIKTVPSAEDIEAERFENSFELVLITNEDEDRIKNIVKSVSEISTVTVKDITLPAGAQEEKTGKKEVTEQGKGNKTDGDKGDAAFQTRRKSNQTVRVDVQRLENLINLVGELVIDRTRLAEVSSELKSSLGTSELLETMEEVSVHIGRITSDLQEEIMKSRMFPIEQVFNRFPRMVRDLARKAGKDIDFIVEGKETELDRTVIEEVGDPLIHLLRNAIDHGIEKPEERKKLGKPLKGTIKLKAFHQENQIVITVEDDGRGMDPEDIKKKALEKGLLSEEAAARLSDREALQLIFRAGFSTARKVSDVSGRGVGMDIVKNHLEKINGIIEIRTDRGKGTKFIIRLPLTLAINRSLLVSSGGRVFAFPLSNVVEIVHLERGTVKEIQKREVTVVRGEVLPLYWLNSVLGLDSGSRWAEEKVPVVIVGISEKRLGFVVDELLGEQEIVIKSLGEFIGQVPGLAGATIMGDGKVALILDVRGLIDQSSGEESHEYAS